MRVAAYICVIALLAYAGMLATTLVREGGSLALSVDPTNRVTSEYELPERKWFRARLRDAGGRQDRADLQRYAWKPEPLEAMSPRSRYAVASRSVGRVQIKLRKASGEVVLIACSGVLVSETLVLTASHCLRTTNQEGKPLQAAIRFGLLNDSLEDVKAAGTLFDLEADPAENQKVLDFAILRLTERDAKRVAAAGFAPARISNAKVAAKDDLFVVGHPFAGPLRLSRADCRVMEVEPDPTTRKFRHSCGTAPGVSGAPIFDDRNCGVVGLHVEAPARAQLGVSIGYGIPVTEILATSRELGSHVVADESLNGCQEINRSALSGDQRQSDDGAPPGASQPSSPAQPTSEKQVAQSPCGQGRFENPIECVDQEFRDNFKRGAFSVEVYGGTETDGHEETVLLVSPRGGNHICTGVLVGPRLVMTAAHCVRQQNVGTVGTAAYFGSAPYDRSAPSIAVEDSDIHSDERIDLALVLLKSSAVSIEGGRPVRFATEKDINNEKNHYVRVVGYGEDEYKRRGKKLLAAVPIASRTCGRSLKLKPSHELIMDDALYGCRRGLELVAGWRAKDLDPTRGINADTCHGDSGGPAFVIASDDVASGIEKGYSAKKYRLAAITSRAITLESRLGIQSPACGYGGIYVLMTDRVQQWVQGNKWQAKVGP